MTRNEPANEENAWVCFWNFVTKLGHVVPYHTIPYHTIPYHTIPYHTIPYHTIPYHTIPYHTVPYHTIPYRIIPYHTVPYHTIPYHTIPYHIISYHIISYHTILFTYLHFFLQFICCTRKWYLGELGRNLPKNVLDKSWLAPPPPVKEVRTVSKPSTPTLATHHVTNSAYISFLISYLNFIKGIRFASRLIFSYYGQEICAWFVS